MKTFIMNYYWIPMFVIVFLLLADTTITFKPFKISMKSLYTAIGYYLIIIGVVVIITESKIKAKHEGVLQGMEDMRKAVSEEIKNGFEKRNIMNTYLEVREFKTEKVVKRYDVTGRPERMIDKFDDGLNINLNHDKYYTIKNVTKRKYNCED